MRSVERLRQRAKKYHKQTDVRRIAVVCRNPIPYVGDEWECIIDTMRASGPPDREQGYFGTKEKAIAHAEANTEEQDLIIVDDI